MSRAQWPGQGRLRAGRDYMIEVALFPIPNVVAFPGTTVPLHVFEPRYRKLVHDCVETERLLGVCHVTKTIREAPAASSIEDALNSNQATYQPQKVFSAGRCEIIEELEDGRILAQIEMQQRFVIEHEVQSLPYRVVSCSQLADLEESENPGENQQLKERVHTVLVDIVGRQNPELAQELGSSAWLEKTAAEYSFEIFQILHFDPETMQHLLEMRSTGKRLITTLSLLSGKPVD